MSALPEFSNPGLLVGSPEYYKHIKDVYRKFWADHDARSVTPAKACSRCKVEFPSTEFTYCASMKDGLNWHCKTCTRRTQIKTKFKLDLKEPRNLGMCAACGEMPATHVDHDHACCIGKTSCGNCVRGFLCQACNLTLRDARDSVKRLSGCIDYLNRWINR